MRKALVPVVILLFLAGGIFANGSSESKSTDSSSRSSRSKSSKKATSNDTKVAGYDKKNGKHVNSYHRSRANDTESDNYSTKGNVNPYTGKKGTKKPKS